MRSTLLGLAFLFLCGDSSEAQDLTVKVIDQITNKPLSNVLIRLHYGCTHSVRQVELKEKTDSDGNAFFHSVSVSPTEFCVFPDYAYSSQEPPVLFTSSGEYQQHYTKSLNKVFTELPAEVIFHVKRLSIAERFRNFWRWD
jgi:hypothetical protein